MGRTCGEPDEIELAPMGVKLNGSRRVHCRSDDGVGDTDSKLVTPSQAVYSVQTRPTESGSHGYLARASPASAQGGGSWVQYAVSRQGVVWHSSTSVWHRLPAREKRR